MLLDPRERPLAALGAAAAGSAALLWLASRRRGAASAPAAAATGFDAYLRDASIGQPTAAAAPTFAATSFEAYLRQTAAAPAEAAAGTGATSCAASATAPADAIPVTVLFGTEYGFSKEVAEKACERLREASPPAGSGAASYWPRLLDMADLPTGLPGLSEGAHQALLVVCSTQGDGVPPTEARDFCDWLASGAAPQLGGAVHFSVCALGDRRVGWVQLRAWGLHRLALSWLRETSPKACEPAAACRHLSCRVRPCQPLLEHDSSQLALPCAPSSRASNPASCGCCAAPRQVLPALLPLRARPGRSARGAGRRAAGASRGRQPRGLEGHRRLVEGRAGGPGDAAAEDSGAVGGAGRGGWRR